MEKSDEVPPWLKLIMKEIDQNPALHLKDWEIRERGVDPARIRRWFKKNHGITFQAYLRSRRIIEAFGRIRHKSKVVDSTSGSGNETLGCLQADFKKTTEVVSSQSSEKNIITITRILSPLGPLFAGATSDGICLLEFTDRRMLETQIKILRKRLNAEFVPGRSQHFNTLDKQLGEYFAGTRKEFDLPLIVPGTEFQKQAWSALQEIPYGQTRSYAQQAKNIGNPNAVRAIGKANGDNRIAIIIPCHRVIATDGSLTGYGGGLWRKKHLLELENRET